MHLVSNKVCPRWSRSHVVRSEHQTGSDEHDDDKDCIPGKDSCGEKSNYCKNDMVTTMIAEYGIMVGIDEFGGFGGRPRYFVSQAKRLHVELANAHVAPS